MPTTSPPSNSGQLNAVTMMLEETLEPAAQRLTQGLAREGYQIKGFDGTTLLNAVRARCSSLPGDVSRPAKGLDVATCSFADWGRKHEFSLETDSALSAFLLAPVSIAGAGLSGGYGQDVCRLREIAVAELCRNTECRVVNTRILFSSVYPWLVTTVISDGRRIGLDAELSSHGASQAWETWERLSNDGSRRFLGVGVLPLMLRAIASQHLRNIRRTETRVRMRMASMGGDDNDAPERHPLSTAQSPAAAPPAELSRTEMANALQKCMSHLEPRTRTIISQCFLFGLTRTQIGDGLALTGQRVGQILSEGCAHLRKCLQGQGFSSIDV